MPNAVQPESLGTAQPERISSPALPPTDADFLIQHLQDRGLELSWHHSGTSTVGVSQPVSAAAAHEAWSAIRNRDGEWNMLVVSQEIAESYASGNAQLWRVQPSPDAAASWFRAREQEVEPPPHIRQERTNIPRDSIPVTDSAPYFVRNGEPVRLLILPVSRELLIAAIGLGGYNEAPDDEDNAVVHPYWHESHGAVPMFAGSYLEFWVEHPPVTHEARTQLAWEQYLYAPDIVEQGTESLSRLASELQKHTWFFWWD